MRTAPHLKISVRVNRRMIGIAQNFRGSLENMMKLRGNQMEIINDWDSPIEEYKNGVDPIILFNPSVQFIEKIIKISNHEKMIWIICTGKINELEDYSKINSPYIVRPFYCRDILEIKTYIEKIYNTYSEVNSFNAPKGFKR